MTYYILPHLGMGDYLVCNGLIRNIVKSEGEYILFCNDRFTVSVPFMFRDLKNLTYSIIPQVEFNGTYILPYIKKSPFHLYLIGYEYLDRSMSYDQSCYKQYHLDFEKRWSDFYVERDLQREKDLFAKYNIKENEYVFIHEDPDRNQIVNRKYIENKELKTIVAEKHITSNIFDYCYLLENAAEIHVIESSFLFLADSIPTNGKLFSHRYARPLYSYTIPNVKKPWVIYK